MSALRRLARVWVTYYHCGTEMQFDVFRSSYYCDAPGCTYTR